MLAGCPGVVERGIETRRADSKAPGILRHLPFVVPGGEP